MSQKNHKRDKRQPHINVRGLITKKKERCLRAQLYVGAFAENCPMEYSYSVRMYTVLKLLPIRSSDGIL
jgi:hypothetical protein